MVPYMDVIVGCHRHVGMDTTNDTHRAGVLSCRLLTPIEGKSRL
jgi:hypothetical protein